MAAKKTDPNAPKCARCDKPGHAARNCKATWRTSWPGKAVVRMSLKHPDGSAIEFVCPLTSDLMYRRADEFLAELIRQSAK